MFYKGAGGDNRPFFATVSTMGFNGLMHVVDPAALPIYLGLAVETSSNPEEFVAKMAVGLTATFAVIGIPIGLKKYWVNRKMKQTVFEGKSD